LDSFYVGKEEREETSRAAAPRFCSRSEKENVIKRSTIADLLAEIHGRVTMVDSAAIGQVECHAPCKNVELSSIDVVAMA
jgi:hypothetical protein